MPDIVFSPLLPPVLLAGLALLALLAAGIGIARRARGAWLRLIPLAVLVLALANPRLAGEEREFLPDLAVVIVDASASQSLAGREAQLREAEAELRSRLGNLPLLEIKTVEVTTTPGEDGGTKLFAALDAAIADVPRRRVAGAILLTDGQVHDVPRNAEQGFPIHVLLTGRPDEADRRLVLVQAPSFGLVGQSVQATIRVEDDAAQGQALVTLRRETGRPEVISVPLNEDVRLRLKVEHAGSSIAEIEVEPGAQELTLANNRSALEVNGVRDRLRVLLVSGEPHAGERTWRNLLKSDPSVDLVHFTILRPPEKSDATPLSELALITFPIQELFYEKLHDFDLIIFDRYRRRGVLPLSYFGNIADYVREGGALLMAAGPEYASVFTLYESPLAEVLPAAPASRMITEPFRPGLTTSGRRHPVTSALPGAQSDPPDWGNWLRLIDVRQNSGMSLLDGAQGRPLLILDRVGEGRVAQLLSDTVWLWSRGYQGGGPQAELLRRLAHWLMKEPELEEYQLRAEIRGERLDITRRSLDAQEQAKVTVTRPDGESLSVELSDQGDGRATASLAVEQPGLYRIDDGTRSAIAASGDFQSQELAELTATAEILAPVAAQNGGAVAWLYEDGLPDLRKIDRDRPAEGRGWIGLRANEDYITRGVTNLPLLPAGLALALSLGGLIAVWWREGR